MRADDDHYSAAAGQSADLSQGPGGSSWVRVCSSADFAPNSPLRIMIGDTPVVIIRGTDGVVHALDDTCTHARVSLSEGSVEGDTIECSAHGATFDLSTGAALSLPATKPLRIYRVAIDDGELVVSSEGHFADGPDVNRNAAT